MTSSFLRNFLGQGICLEIAVDLPSVFSGKLASMEAEIAYCKFAV